MRRAVYQLCYFALAVLLLAVPSQAMAGPIGFDNTGGGNGGTNGTRSIGFAFTVTAPVTIDTLLMFDHASNGFANGPYTVSIFNDGGSTTLANANLTASFDGTSQSLYSGDTPPLGGWREVDITDTVLGIGSYTIIASSTNFGDIYLLGQTVTPATGLTYEGGRSANTAGANPNADYLEALNGYFGPNFTLATVIVPVPAATWLALPLLGVLAVKSRRRR